MNQNSNAPAVSIICPVCHVGNVEGYVSSYFDRGVHVPCVELSCGHCGQNFNSH